MAYSTTTSYSSRNAEEHSYVRRIEWTQRFANDAIRLKRNPLQSSISVRHPKMDTLVFVKSVKVSTTGLTMSRNELG